MSTAADRRVVVYCAGVSWDAVRGTDRHLATRLARHVDVLWIDPPVSVLRASSMPRARAQEVAPGVVRVATVAPPFPSRRAVLPLTQRIMRRAIRRAARAHGGTVEATIVTTPLQPLGVIGGGRQVYFATDDFVAGAELMGGSRASIARCEQRRVAEADLLVGVTAEIVERWQGGTTPTLVLPNGCDVEAYAQSDEAALPTDVDLRPPVAGVVGQLSSRLDLALLEAVVDRGSSLLLVGPVQAGFEPERFAALVERPSVAWVGRRDFAELPSYLRLVDVGLTPYVDSAFNRASFPLKTLEYLAAGRPVVSTPLPAVAEIGSPLVTAAAGPAAFARAAEQAAAARALDPTGVAAEARRTAREHDWDVRAVSLLKAIGPAVPDPIGPPVGR